MKGCVFTIGGNEDKRAHSSSILAAFVEGAGGADARIVIIPSASEFPEKRAEQYERIFARLGAGCVRSIHAERGEVSRDELMLLQNASGIFVTGGDQARLMQHLHRTGCTEAIVEAVRAGAVYAGTSAGASAVSGRMIAGSTRLRGADVVEFAEGLGLLPGVIVDQHFSERRRLTRLIRASADERLPGVGIDEDTAVVWDADGTISVLGAGSVTLVRPQTAGRTAYRVDVLQHGMQDSL